MAAGTVARLTVAAARVAAAALVDSGVAGSVGVVDSVGVGTTAGVPAGIVASVGVDSTVAAAIGSLAGHCSPRAHTHNHRCCWWRWRCKLAAELAEKVEVARQLPRWPLWHLLRSRQCLQ